MSDLSLQFIYNSLHADSFQHVDLNNLSDTYDVVHNDRGVYFIKSNTQSYFKIGEITKDRLLYIRKLLGI